MTPQEVDLDTLTQAMEAFVNILLEESEALTARDAARLDGILPRRNDVQARITQSWGNLTTRLGLLSDASMDDVRRRLYPRQTPPPWHRLEKLAQEGSRLNQLNSQVIDEQMRRTQAALQVLHNAASRRGLYGSDGRLSNVLNTSRTIDTV